MEASEFRNLIEQLGYSQVAVSRLLGVNDRTGRRWASGEQDIPRAVEITLDLMRRFGLTADVMGQILANRVAGTYGDMDPEYHVWVRPRVPNAEWTVAKFNRKTRVYLLPGNPLGFKLSELELGPRVHMLQNAPDQ
jgi:hypothetical protein